MTSLTCLLICACLCQHWKDEAVKCCQRCQNKHHHVSSEGGGHMAKSLSIPTDIWLLLAGICAWFNYVKHGELSNHKSVFTHNANSTDAPMYTLTCIWLPNKEYSVVSLSSQMAEDFQWLVPPVLPFVIAPCNTEPYVKDTNKATLLTFRVDNDGQSELLKYNIGPL